MTESSFSETTESTPVIPQDQGPTEAAINIAAGDQPAEETPESVAAEVPLADVLEGDEPQDVTEQAATDAPVRIAPLPPPVDYSSHPNGFAATPVEKAGDQLPKTSEAARAGKNIDGDDQPAEVVPAEVKDDSPESPAEPASEPEPASEAAPEPAPEAEAELKSEPTPETDIDAAPEAEAPPEATAEAEEPIDSADDPADDSVPVEALGETPQESEADETPPTPEAKFEESLNEVYQEPAEDELPEASTLEGCVGALKEYFDTAEEVTEAAVAIALGKMPQDCLYPTVDWINNTTDQQPPAAVEVARKVTEEQPEVPVEDPQLHDLRERYIHEGREIGYYDEFTRLEGKIGERRAQLTADMTAWQQIPQERPDSDAAAQEAADLQGIALATADDMRKLRKCQEQIAKYESHRGSGGGGKPAGNALEKILDKGMQNVHAGILSGLEKKRGTLGAQLKANIDIMGAAHPNTVHAALEASSGADSATTLANGRQAVATAQTFIADFDEMRGFRDPAFRGVVDGVSLDGAHTPTAALDTAYLAPAATAATRVQHAYMEYYFSARGVNLGEHTPRLARICRQASLVGLFGRRS